MGNFLLKFCKTAKDSNNEGNHSYLFKWGSSSKKYTKKELGVQPPEKPIHTNSILVVKATEEYLGEECNDLFVYTGELDGRVKRITESKQKVLNSWRHHEKSISDIDVVNGYIATASRDRTIKLFSSASAVETNLEGHSLGVTACEFSSESSRLWSGSRDTTVRYWDTDTAKAIRIWETPRNIVRGMRKAASEFTVVQTSEDLTVKIWDSRFENPAHTFTTGPNIPQAVDVSGDYIATGHNGFNGMGCEIILIDQRMGKILKTLHGHTEAVNSVSFVKSSGGKFLVSGSKDQSVRLWNVGNSTPLYATPEEYGSIFSVSSVGGHVFAGNMKSYLMVYIFDETKNRLKLKSIL